MMLILAVALAIIKLPIGDSAPVDAQKPPDSGPSCPYYEQEVSFANEKHRVRLAGTLTLPQHKGPISAVVLITGFGPHDRNAEMFGHKPFLVLADHLTRLGL